MPAIVRRLAATSRALLIALGRWRTTQMLARLAAGATIAACSGWGPTQFITGRYVYGTDSSGTRTAIGVTYVEQEVPTGLAAFPDGGSPRVLKQGMLLYVCDALTEPVHFLGFVSQPDQSPNVDVRVLSWQADGFDAAFRESGAQPPVFSAFHILIAGGTRSLGVPVDTVQASQVIAPSCQRTVDSLELSSRRRGANGFYDRP